MKVYISSTIEDLKEHRAKVYRQLRKLRHDVISMEDYVAGPDWPINQCLSDVRAADIYIGIFAWRYGYVPPHNNPQERSITELEYRAAIEANKQCLIFILDKGALWMPQLMDAHTGEGDSGKAISRFRNELAERHTVASFGTGDELVSDVIAAVYRVQYDQPPRLLQVSSEHAPTDAAAPPGRKRASARENYRKLWMQGQSLRVSFLGGSPRQQRLVKRFAPLWSAYANIHFEFGDDSEAEIRVSFDKPGNWSYLGADALLIPQDLPTLNLGWIRDDTPDAEAEHVILHQFGTALGLLMEHRNPLAKIPWDKKAVYKAYSLPPYSWSRREVDAQIFLKYPPGTYPVEKPFDPTSIMAYPIPPEFTGGQLEIGQNLALSPGDKEYISLLYPYAAESAPQRRQPSQKRRRAR